MQKVHDQKFKRKCPDCGDEILVGYKYMWEIKTGKKQGKCLKCANQKTTSTSFKKGQKPWNKGVGTTPFKLKNLQEWKWWRKSVFERDQYKCTECGEIGGAIEGHHVLPASLFPELAFQPWNGKTLCVQCHKNTDTYGFRAKKWTANSYMEIKIKQFEDWLNNENRSIELYQEYK